MNFWMIIMLSVAALAEVRTESFIIKINDRSMSVTGPERRREMFSVIVENHSLSAQTGKFMLGEKNIKFVSIPSGAKETVEINNKASTNVVFYPVSPAFQEVELIFGKKAYEIPSEK